ncbi:MAG: hypothetical protein ACK5RN_01305 [bacterium]
MSTPPESTPRAGDAWRWWESRRLRYNIGLAVAGWVAWGLAAAAIWSVVPLIPFPTDNPEGTLFTVLIQGVLYLLFMAAANLLYLLGPLSEAVLRPAEVDGFRRRMFGLGFWFSVALPFAFPAMTLISLLSMVEA